MNKLFLISNESIYKNESNEYFCDNLDMKSTPEGLGSSFEVNTIVWIYSRRAIMKIGKRIPNKTIVYKTPKERSIDIDNQNDINLINFYLKNNEKKK